LAQAEAVIGVLYIAILVFRLVRLYTTRDASTQDDSDRKK
jgi:hypothetical protein